MQNCTNANDTRVAQCREDPVKGEYTLVRGATGVAPTPDTCWDTPPSVYLSYDGDYDAVTRTASAYDAFEASFKEKLGFRNAFVDPSAAHVRFGSCSESCFGAGEFLRIPVNRVAVESVVPGSVGVYFYLLQRAPSAPLNEYGVEEAYAYLDSAFTSGTPKLAASEMLMSRAFLTRSCSRHAGAPIPGRRVFVRAGLAYRRAGRLRASAATVRPNFSLTNPTAANCVLGRRRPPPVICREVVEFESCVDSGCAWYGPSKLSYLLYRTPCLSVLRVSVLLQGAQPRKVLDSGRGAHQQIFVQLDCAGLRGLSFSGSLSAQRGRDRRAWDRQ